MCDDMIALVDGKLEYLDLNTRDVQKLRRSVWGFQKHTQYSLAATKKIGKQCTRMLNIAYGLRKSKDFRVIRDIKAISAKSCMPKIDRAKARGMLKLMQ